MNSNPFGKSFISPGLGYSYFDVNISLRYNFMIFAALLQLWWWTLFLLSFLLLFNQSKVGKIFETKNVRTTMALIIVEKITISSLQLYFQILTCLMCIVEFLNLQSYFCDCIEFAVTLFFWPMVQHSKFIKYCTIKSSSNLFSFVFWKSVKFCHTYWMILPLLQQWVLNIMSFKVIKLWKTFPIICIRQKDIDKYER